MPESEFQNQKPRGWHRPVPFGIRYPGSLRLFRAGTIGIEVPKKSPKWFPCVRSLLHQNSKMRKWNPPMALENHYNRDFVVDLAKMPTYWWPVPPAMEKSVGLNAILLALCKNLAEVKFVWSTQKVEHTFQQNWKGITSNSRYRRSHHYRHYQGNQHPGFPLYGQMDTRYDLLKEAHGAEHQEYNEKFKARKLNPTTDTVTCSYILFGHWYICRLNRMTGQRKTPIARLAQLARAIKESIWSLPPSISNVITRNH